MTSKTFRKFLMIGAALAALGAGACATMPAGKETASATAPGASADDALAFLANAEKTLAELNEYASRANWVQATNITFDSNYIAARANAEATETLVNLANESKRFDATPLPPDAARKMKLLKLALTLPAPRREGAAAEIAAIGTRLETTYSTGKLEYKGKQITLDDAADIMATSRNPAELKAVWEGWHKISVPMKADYTRQAALANEGAREMGFADTGALWRSNYDMDPDAFAAETDRLWSDVEPLYKSLHCYVRGKLNARYGDAVQPKTGPIRADLLSNMWAQDWSGLYPMLAPKGADSGIDVTARLKAKGYTPEKMVKTGEGFFTSLGFAPLPQTFWDRSMIVRPRDREVTCHASAWNMDAKDDLRIKMCTKVNEEDFVTIHHELGHNFYQRAYKDQPALFQNGANDGFHEAIGDMIALSVTPEYLKQIGLIDKVPSADKDTGLLLARALDKVAFLPFGLLIDRWRWDVYAGKTAPEQYNDAWWALRLKYQGVAAPGPRPADAFDPGAKYHVPSNVPYTRYFLAHILQFQFQRAACREAGWTGPLHRCSIYGNKAVGAKFNQMLEMGQSKPWPDALYAFTGERTIDSSALVDYFAPLKTWLDGQNKGQTCGW